MSHERPPTICLTKGCQSFGNTYPGRARSPGSLKRAQLRQSGNRAPGIDTLNAVPETSYASCDDLSIAYQVFGDGPIELVFVGPFVSHVELSWALPEFKAHQNCARSPLRCLT